MTPIEVFVAYDGSFLHDMLRVVYGLLSALFLITVFFLLRGDSYED